MLKILVKGKDFFNEKTNEFIYVKDTELCLEHSLVSISKWEMKYQKPFLNEKDKTREEIIDYIKFMTLTQNVSDDVYLSFSEENFKDINDYINNKMTATTITNRKKNKKDKEVITSEIIYYWMVTLQIPFECQKWHINRLLTLIQVCNINNSGEQNKMSTKDIMSHNHELNEMRKKQLHTKG